ncbi:hypothetical protein BCAL_1770 [Bifidobacterium callitrichos DSM 23973]|uniref:DUF2975 domain-containing protein n=1 Tax=Bifidobacterium callitrichos DSM 23973 TaxID=1437609 RepID=A0A086ZZ94_9BIFI|nr:hypothetical protein BCAL_1770 [Bifidobacterium callitrichos DSM 23973]
MQRYMNRWVLDVLKGIVVLIWIGCLWGQAVVVPTLSQAVGDLFYPQNQAAMRWPYLIAGELFLLCVEIAFGAVWRLLTLSGSGRVFTAKALTCVNWVIGCAAAATALTLLVLVVFLISGWNDPVIETMDYYAVAFMLGVVLIAEIGFDLLMTVMRGLLRAATDQSDELEQVI